MNKEIKWIKKANADLDTVKILLKANNPHTEIIGFHCQQAVEKYLKAYLVFINLRVPKIHDIDSLLQICILKDFEFSKFDRLKISALTDFAVDYRYPDILMEPDLKEVKEYYKIAERLKDFILSRIE